ncbi:pickpocket protein 28-like [Zophobas morio]|uniref:pickpocket protein 28-like n=1 Tax=Zophobas morio TaxID=2755281 RepID=UPI0030832CBC
MSDVKITIPGDEETSKTKNIEKQPNKQKRKFLETVSTHWSEFLGNSTIHGFRYLTGTERSIFEKFWWICIISISVYICGLLINSTWQKWEDTPVFMTMSQKPVPLQNIPFPAVTICPGYRYLPSTHFDNRNISNWTPDENYVNMTAHDIYPFRSKNILSDLLFTLNILNEVGCQGYDGFKIIIHHPAEFPTSSTSSIYIGSIDSYFVWIKPEITLTSKDLKSLSFRRRKCYYSNERRLRFFKFYTMEYCKLECLTNYTLKLCGCVPYYFPHNRTTKICGRSQFLCFPSLSGDDWSLSQVKFTIEGFSSESCDCLPSCTAIKYTSELVKKPTKPLLLHPGSEVVIKFRNEEFMAMERQELFGVVNFWANCGGLLGLFTGFSFISLAEIIYYLVFRWIFILGRRLWHRIPRN